MSGLVPSLCRLLTSNDRAIRRSLLENMDSFGTKFDAATVEEKVRSQIHVPGPRAVGAPVLTRAAVLVFAQGFRLYH